MLRAAKENNDLSCRVSLHVRVLNRFPASRLLLVFLTEIFVVKMCLRLPK